MAPAGAEDDPRFTKSKRNQGVQRTGRELLLLDGRFRDPDLATKRAILERLPKKSGFGPSSFDLVMCPPMAPPILPATLQEQWPNLRLVEMKATRKPIKDASLNRFFFGVTENEIRMAETLGDRYLFAFVVLNGDNAFGRPFARLLTLNELRRRTKPWRTQFQVNFRSNLPPEGLIADDGMILVLERLEEGQ